MSEYTVLSCENIRTKPTEYGPKKVLKMLLRNADGVENEVEWFTSEKTNEPAEGEKIEGEVSKGAYGLNFKKPKGPGGGGFKRSPVETKAIQRQHCQLPSAGLLTPDLKVISHGDAVEGMPLLGFDETGSLKRNRRFQAAEVTSAGRAVAPCYEVKLADGSVHIATGNHGWLLGGSKWWTTTDRLRTGPRPSRVMSLLTPVRPDYSREAGWMAGFLDGEGCISSNRAGGIQISFGQAEGGVLEHAKAWLRVRGFDFYENHIETRRYNNSKPLGKVAILGGLREQLRLLMLARPERLVAKVPEQLLGHRSLYGKAIAVESVEPVGDQEVVTLHTSTRTYVGDGLAFHNSQEMALRYHATLVAAGNRPLNLEQIHELTNWMEADISGKQPKGITFDPLVSDVPIDTKDLVP